MDYSIFFFLILIQVLAYLLFRLYRGLLNKFEIGKSSHRMSLSIFSAALTIIGILSILIIERYYNRNMDFDPELWNSNVEERYKMSEDIIESQMLIGLNSKEVIDLLGKEDLRDKDSALIYSLGLVPGITNIDPDVMKITFENGKVKDVIQYES